MDRDIANIIVAQAHDDEIERIVETVNTLIGSRRIHRASVIVACAQILAQDLTGDGPELAFDLRRGFVALIDAYAMRIAVSDGGEP